MKTRVAWKMWKNDDDSPRYAKAMRTIETRTRRYYNKQARKALKNGNTMMYEFYINKAECGFLMENILFKEDILFNEEECCVIKAGKSYYIW